MPTNRLLRTAQLFHGLTVVSLVLLPALIFVALWWPKTLGVEISAYAELPPDGWSWNIWLGVIVALVPFVFAMLALNGMRKLFLLYRAGDPFHSDAGGHIRSIGLNLLISALLGVAIMPVRTGLMTLSNPVGERSISVGVGTSDIGFTLVAGLLLMIGWSMTEATKAVAENKEFI